MLKTKLFVCGSAIGAVFVMVLVWNAIVMTLVWNAIAATTPVENVKAFLEADLTDRLRYSESFNCVNFSRTMVQNALDSGFAACVVKVSFPDDAHDLVAFYTAEGVVYVEPQFDKIMNPRIGEPYWDRDYFDIPEHNDTIESISSCFMFVY